MGKVIVKPGVEFGPNFAFAGARILEVVKRYAEGVDHDIVITSARDGKHSGPGDPHYSGEAFDIRTNSLNSAQKLALLHYLIGQLHKDPRRFYVFLEAEGTPNEHIHAQRRNGTTYSALDYLNSL